MTQQVAELQAYRVGARALAARILGAQEAELVDRVRAETGLAVDVKLECECSRVSPDVAVAVFRVAQEALTNVVRHSRATRVEMRLANTDRGLDLSVDDDGHGFDVNEAQAHPTSSVGLFGMAERVALVSGELELRSKSGTGAHVGARVPFREEAST